MSLTDRAFEAKEQRTREDRSRNDRWHEKFQMYLKHGQFRKAREYAEKNGAEMPLVCSESHDFFEKLVREGRKKEYLAMIRAFDGYSFECWLVCIGSKPQIYKSRRRQ